MVVAAVMDSRLVVLVEELDLKVQILTTPKLDPLVVDLVATQDQVLVVAVVVTQEAPFKVVVAVMVNSAVTLTLVVAEAAVEVTTAAVAAAVVMTLVRPPVTHLVVAADQRAGRLVAGQPRGDLPELHDPRGRSPLSAENAESVG